MGRISKKTNKNVYQMSREELGYSREKASEILEGITKDKIEKIESEKMLPRPEEVMLLAKGYQKPELRNHYCANQCPIGMEYVPEVHVRNLPQIILEMVASLNSMQKKKDRLIEITADGLIEEEEIKDFIHIQEELSKISLTVKTLELWSEQMLDNGCIDMETYNKFKK